MDLEQLITPAQVVCRNDVNSKKKALDVLSHHLAAARPDRLDSRAVLDSLLGRERLGSTGLGQGVALPHGRLAGTDQAVGAVLKLNHGIDFGAMDEEPVDLLFGLIVPEHFTDEHLKILAYLAEMFSNEAFCQRLRLLHDDQLLYQELINWRLANS